MDGPRGSDASSDTPQCAAPAAAPEFTDDSATKLDADAAIAIFLARDSGEGRDGKSKTLSEQHRITTKAVRDVWNLRTWARDTMPYWTREDEMKFLRKRLCIACQRNGVASLAEACGTCAAPRRRGRPRRAMPPSGDVLMSLPQPPAPLTDAGETGETGDTPRENPSCDCDAQGRDTAQEEWKLCAVWLTPSEEREPERDDAFDSLLDRICSAAHRSDCAGLSLQ